MMCLNCKCKTKHNDVVQGVEKVVVGAHVRFTDKEIKANIDYMEAFPQNTTDKSGDWYVVDKVDAEGYVAIQRAYCPSSKITTHVRYIYVVE